MPQARPSKQDGLLAAMMLDADDGGGKGPSRRAHAVRRMNAVAPRRRASGLRIVIRTGRESTLSA
ncbi:hypothetical protein WS89_23900 [Burkholderia sp. MSMB1072]|nr:hypothetical protein WS61_21030 [Burkholderia sp. ABCPW 11]KVH56197.1 hypothetical protein WS89_23900 [Burkholderia sp. MSMB1072]